ncbi:acyltransferase [Litorimonas cladophorae]|uniref:Acyltransferase n=2 Tax=Litorimonas cladophorae TaxID=1220491 RepID=A0A918KC15_9PROT|nr:acyltransferase [Litorimonas cladophorae]
MLYHYTFSYLAVNLFFIASGFLVTKSMVYRGDTPSFISARVLRIFPALAIHVLFVMFIIGPLATNIAWNDFFSSPDWYLQPLMVLTFFETDMNLPGIFDTNAEQFGSATLWTLRYEVIAYIGTLAVFSLGFLRKKWMVLAQFVLPSIGWIIGTRFGIFEALPGTIENLFRFGIAYGLGAAIYAYRERLNFGWITLAALITASYLLRKTEVLEVVMNAVLCWVIFRVAYMKAPKWAWLQRIPDLSYGIYIYHWCVLQLLFYWFPQLSVMELFALSFPPTVALAALSWYIVEKPMLRNKIKFANWLRGLGFKRPMAKQQYLLD